MSLAGFWAALPKPFFAAAPLANVTDTAFRRMLAKYGRADVIWTEFVSATGLQHPKGRAGLLPDLRFHDSERPVVAQLFTNNIDHMYQVSKMCELMGFQGIDINMGCPDKSVMKSLSGASLIGRPGDALALVTAAKMGAPKTPVSVKTRLGIRDKYEFRDWLPHLCFKTSVARDSIAQTREYLTQKYAGLVTDIEAIEKQVPVPYLESLVSQLAAKPDIHIVDGELSPLAALTIHFRTAKELSLVDAHWTSEIAGEAVPLIRSQSPSTLIIGNGDITSMSTGVEKANQWGLDGYMIGRGIIGRPWIGNLKMEHLVQNSMDARLNLMMEHALLYAEEFVGEERRKGTKELRQNVSRLMDTDLFSEPREKRWTVIFRHLMKYIECHPDAKKMRAELSETRNLESTLDFIKKYKQNSSSTEE